MTPTKFVWRVPLAVGSAVLAAAPVAAALLGADPFRVWFQLPQWLAIALRFVLLSYSVSVLAWTASRLADARTSSVVAGALGAVALLGALTAAAAATWSSPGSATDSQEWIVLHFCPIAGLVAFGGSSTALLGRGPRTPPGRTKRLLGASMLTGATGVLAYFALRQWLPQVVRVVLPLTVGTLVAGLLGASVLDQARSSLVRCFLAGFAVLVLVLMAGL
jgi:hypothetical protein